jgi:Phage Tail Collar Domain
MADLTFILTTAGFNALVNPANTGTNAITIDRIGVSSVVLPGSPESNVGIVQLPNELKRIASFGGDVVGDNTIHVTIRDESVDVYALRTFGLYSAGGVLLAFYTQPTPIMEKAASSMLLLAADLQFTNPISAELVFGDTYFINPPATTERQGVVELATAPETATGTDATRAVTPFGLKSLLTALLAGYSQTGHAHAASDVTSGTFADARIPSLAQSKIIGLVDALAGKAASVHTHAMSEITGLVGALGLKLAIADFTWQNLVGKPNVAINGQTVTFQDVTANRGDGTGALFFGTGRYLYSAVGYYELVGAPLIVAGHQVWTAGTFDPSTKANLSGAAFTGQITATGVHIKGPAGGYRELTFRTGDSLRWDLFADTAAESGANAGSNLVLARYSDAGDYLGIAMTVNRSTGGVAFGARPTWNGAVPWDNANFNPADKAAAVHSHDWAQVTGKPFFQASTSAQLRLDDTNAVRRVQLYGDPDGFGFLNTALGGWSLRITGAALYFTASGVERTVWHTGNFDPATKATLNQDVTFNAVRAYGGGGTGAVYLGGPARYVYFNGSEYEMPSSPIRNEGHIVWHEGNALDKACPAGEIKYLASPSIPSGLRALHANGAAISRATYARLFNVIGTTYGVGDGATTFNLPDLRGVFVRGLDNGRGLDSGRTLHSLQMSQNLLHNHSIQSRSSTGSNNGYVEDGDSDGIVRSMFTGFEGGSEARPVNEALLAVITY